MLIRKLERDRADRFLGETRDPDHAMADETDEECLSAYLGERCAPHRGRPTPVDAVVHHLVLDGFMFVQSDAAFASEADIRASSDPADANRATPEAGFDAY